VIDMTGADRIDGPLLVVEGCPHAAFGEVVEVRTERGVHLGEVLAAGSDRTVVELWGDTSGLRAADVRIRFHGAPLRAAVGADMLGRVFDGLGRPRDGLPAPLAEARWDVHGGVINPVARTAPHQVIETGISAIDTLTTLVRGQKLPIFSAAGLPHDELAAQIALQARIEDDPDRFAVVFAALGVPHTTVDAFVERFRASGLLDRTTLFMNLADDPPMERIVTPRIALTVAEYLAFERGIHVLVILTDITNYAEALRELSARKHEVPGRKGYPGYLYTDLASLFERCGCLRGRTGSLTQIPVLTMPGDDITHPIPDLTGYISEGQIVLSRALSRAGVYPPIDVLLSLSRLMKDAIGGGQTRQDHGALAAELFSACARVREVRTFAAIVGEAGLSPSERTFLAFGEAFEASFLRQGSDERRALADSFDRAWDALGLLSPGERRHAPTAAPAGPVAAPAEATP
jgi:V/A-type H+/Na+-transporting ATPase subunit B